LPIERFDRQLLRIEIGGIELNAVGPQPMRGC
jgi:hypothetical protein